MYNYKILLFTLQIQTIMSCVCVLVLSFALSHRSAPHGILTWEKVMATVYISLAMRMTTDQGQTSINQLTFCRWLPDTKWCATLQWRLRIHVYWMLLLARIWNHRTMVKGEFGILLFLAKFLNDTVNCSHCAGYEICLD